MTGNIKVNWKRLILAMVISIGAGVISWLLTGNSMEIYRDLNKPVLSPPGQLFPIVWTILFILMGLASYIVCETRDDDRTEALILYGVQLVINIGWAVSYILQLWCFLAGVCMAYDIVDFNNIYNMEIF